MAFVCQIGDGKTFWVRSARCLGCPCFSPGIYHCDCDTGSLSRICLTTMEQDCPEYDCDNYNVETEKQNREKGWLMV